MTWFPSTYTFKVVASCSNVLEIVALTKPVVPDGPLTVKFKPPLAVVVELKTTLETVELLVIQMGWSRAMRLREPTALFICVKL